MKGFTKYCLFIEGYRCYHVVVIINAGQFHSMNPELRFCAGSSPACSVPEVCYGEDL